MDAMKPMKHCPGADVAENQFALRCAYFPELYQLMYNIVLGWVQLRRCPVGTIQPWVNCPGADTAGTHLGVFYIWLSDSARFPGADLRRCCIGYNIWYNVRKSVCLNKDYYHQGELRSAAEFDVRDDDSVLIF